MSDPVFYDPSTGQANQNIPGLNAASGPYARQTHAQQPGQQGQYQAPQQQYQQQQQPQYAQHGQPQHQPQQGQPGMQNASQLFADTPLSQYVDSPLGQMGASYAQQFMANNKFIKGSLQNYESFRALKQYFNVNTSYVRNKLRLVLFPLRHKSWNRRIHRQQDSESYLPPRDDINAPDLYIPTMAFVSYVLIVAFLMGEAWHFSPEVVGEQFSSSLMALVFEVVFVKAGFYFLSSASVPLYDVIGYCGYKYVGITLSTLIGFMLGQLAFYVVLLLTGVGMAVFMVKSFKRVAPPASAALAGGAGGANSLTNLRNYFLLAVGALQLLMFYVLGHYVPVSPTTFIDEVDAAGIDVN